MERMAYTPVEAAELLGLSRAKTYQLIRSGDLASVKIGSSRRIRREAISALLDRIEAEQRSSDDAA